MSTILRERTRANKQLRCCVRACGLPRAAGTVATLCVKHLTARSLYGHEKGKALHAKRWRPYWTLAREWLRQNPPSEDVIQAVARVLDPGTPIPLGQQRPSNPASLLQRELLWWHHPRSAKKLQRPGYRADTSPTGVLTVILAVDLFSSEREVELPADTRLDVAMAIAVLRMRRRPIVTSWNTGGRHSLPYRGSLRKLLAQRIRKQLGRWLLMNSRECLTARMAREGEKRYTPPAPAISVERARSPVKPEPTYRIIDGFRVSG
jgi:hypothetical protein